ncbi:UNKNOWN [Stylonychia lemnae]|uniref:N-acetyltransferase domain-containing protein n=1 Tax=Stylonychia lemnae TaxID=5949 RepID=A0A078AA25_STYLE|nr:UNKNOWN [Stylonychia lemnae]|eukprot:CDW78741.1 UNKNOWN [Stylonychia lemnae]
MALSLRADEFLKLEEFKTLNKEEMISEFEKQTAYRIFEQGTTFAAFDGEQLVSYYFTYDLTFEPFAEVDKLNSQQQVIRNIRLDAIELLKPQPGLYRYLGYTTTKEEYRRNKLIWKLSLSAMKESISKGYRYGVFSIASLAMLRLCQSIGCKIIKYYGPIDENDKKNYYFGEGEFSKDMAVRGIAVFDSNSIDASILNARL